jgi:tetratricopeptide (TPR) repeat protein
MAHGPIDRIRELHNSLKNNPGLDTSAVCEQITEVFPKLSKEDKKSFCATFLKFANTQRKHYPVIHICARHMELAEHFFSENYEAVLNTAPSLQEDMRKANEQEAVFAVDAIIGAVHRTLGNTELALKILWQTFGQLNKSNRFSHYKMSCSFNIGSIYTELNNEDEARPILENTLSLAEKLQDSTFTIHTLFAIGRLYLKQKNYENSRSMFSKALEVAEQSAITLYIASAQTEMGNYYFEAGNYDESEKLHSMAVETRIADKVIGGAITNYIRLGEINIKQSQPDEAIRVLNKGLALAEQIRIKPKMYQIHLLLSDIYHGKNDMVRGFFHYRQFHNLKEEAGKEDNAKKIKNVKLVFDAEQTLQENKIIKQQRDEIHKKNIELLNTIDELTLTKAGKKAKAFTLLVAIIFFIFEDSIIHFVFHLLHADNFWLSLSIKGVIIFSLKPINSAIEHYLVRKVIRRKKRVFDENEYKESRISSDLNFTF